MPTYWIADCYFKQGNFSAAVLRFDDVARQYPTGDKAADALYRQGEALLRHGSRRDGGGQRIRAGAARISRLAARAGGEAAARAARAQAERRRENGSDAGPLRRGELELNKRDLQRFRKLLYRQRDQILGNAKRALSGDIHVDPDDFPDEMDIASSEVNLQFAGRLREREQGLLAKIDAALAKIEHGEYGNVRDVRRADRRRAPRGAPGGRALHRLQVGAGEARAPHGR